MSAPEELLAIIRPAHDRKVDDVVISGDLFRMEQMDRSKWWLAIYRGENRVSFWLEWDKKKRDIIAYVTDDELGCTNDSAQVYEGDD